jgi:branched-chain amino acid aminotransferase
MRKSEEDLIILNGKAATSKDFNPGESAILIYEVIRLLDGQFLFLEDHLMRLRNSCERSGINCPGKALLTGHLEKLLTKTQISYGNVRLIVFEAEEKTNTACFFVPHFYPTAEDYAGGVLTRTFAYERPDPTVKKWNEQFRKNVGKFIQEEKIYEAILLNKQGKLTEGSRSNLFFIDHTTTVYTAPEQLILPGITRKHILNICDGHNFRVIEKAVSLSEAAAMKSCFISGTSPRVLPVKQLESLTFDVRDPVMRTIMGAFDQLIRKPE